MDQKNFKKNDFATLEWHISDTLVPYEDALTVMETRVAAIASGQAPELIWLLEHPPLYTAGTSARQQDLLMPERFPVYVAGRGGQYTYHGPGQRIIYVMLDLKKRGTDVRKFVNALEQWVIDTLEAFNVKGERRCDRVGVWVKRSDKGPGPNGQECEDKIAAIGVRIRKWVSFHGIAINIAPDLDHFSGIVPCGISGHGVTSLEDLGQLVSMPDVDLALKKTFERNFGRDFHHTSIKPR